MKQPWLPNWKDASAYPDPDSTAPDQWAWEFLRRNPEYQQDFSVLMTFFDCENGICRPIKLAQHGYDEADEATRALASFCEKYGLEYAIFPPAPNSDFSRIGSLKASWGPAHVTYQAYFLSLGRERIMTPWGDYIAVQEGQQSGLALRRSMTIPGLLP